MKKFLCWAILGYILLPLLLPIGIVLANDSIRITATGTNVTGLSNFTVVASNIEDNSFQADGSWDNPASLDYIVIRRSFTDYPSSPTDGELVYQGTGESFSEIITGTAEEVYYSGWVYLSGEYSAVSHYLLEVESGMVNAILLGVFVFFALAPTITASILGASRGGGIMAGVGALAWLVLGIFSYTQHVTTWDIYFSIFFASIFMVLICLLMPAMLLRKRDLKEAEEDWGIDEPLRRAILADEQDNARMNRVLGKRKSKRGKSNSIKRFEQRGEF